ncbi:MAG: rhomboid family intramembrane serine protease [Chlamydiales bacterium]|nr:rhomboid family intramembrane serine protease [Chlamydiales bacterium]
MRLICTIDAVKENPIAFSHYLLGEGIQNQCEESSPGQYSVWIIDEDQVEEAAAFYAEFQKDPQNPKYHAHFERMQQIQEEEELAEEEPPPPPPRRRGILSSAPYGPISICIIAAAILLFIWAQVQRGVVIPPKIPGVIQAPVLAPIERKLVYDYPTYFGVRDQLLKLYTPQDIKEEAPPSTQAKGLMQELRRMPTWMGAYDRIVMHVRNKEAKLTYKGPMFEDIKQGQVWRIVTPALLHFDFLHIFFNLLWFIVLGNQIEHRLGSLRYLLLVLALAIASNTSQYLMSGPFFMGLSGIVCGMAAFIWARQQVAPWEGYLLHRFTLIFLGIFVIGMFFLQLAFFFLQIFGKFEATVGIANTAHLIGALTGYLLGRMRRTFQIKSAIRS